MKRPDPWLLEEAGDLKSLYQLAIAWEKQNPQPLDEAGDFNSFSLEILIVSLRRCVVSVYR